MNICKIVSYRRIGLIIIDYASDLLENTFIKIFRYFLDNTRNDN